MSNPKPSICVGVPFYGAQDAEWWSSFAMMMLSLGKNCNVQGLLTSGTMATDHNRNEIIDAFLNKYTADWMFWVDADTVIPMGTPETLLQSGKTMVSALYYGKNPPHPPIAYYKSQGAYQSIHEMTKWERGEILPVDATGFGAMLTHRSVFEKIRDNFTILQREGGGLVPVHNSRIEGEIAGSHEHDGKVWKGQLRTRMTTPTIRKLRFPFFGLEFGRTEDMWFFDLAEQVGEKPWLDTGIECGHLRPVAFTGADYRAEYGA